jgi:hypothetical protein
MIKAETTPDTIEGITRDKVLLILEWCKNRFGKSGRKKTYPTLRVYKSSGFYADNEYYTKKERFNKCGEYDANSCTIFIFLKSNGSYEELCGTFLHEYKHYLLNSAFSNELIKSKKQHPHERYCNWFEKKWKKICYNELKDKLLS